MKTRFDKAVMKLYTAFHEETLNAFRCGSCAVGNIVGHSGWAGYQGDFNDIEKRGDIGICEGRYPDNSDYSTVELQEIEKRFLTVWAEARTVAQTPELQFKGLCEVVKYLAELDGVENPMEIMHLFKNKELVL